MRHFEQKTAAEILLKLDQQRNVETCLSLAQLRSKPRNKGACRTGVAAGWGNSARSGKVRHIGGTVVVLKPESCELARHVIEGGRTVPGLELISWVQREIGSSGKCGGAINRRQKDQVAAGVRHSTASNREGKQVMVKPPTVIKHAAQKSLFGTLAGIAQATHTAARFASCIRPER